MGLFDKKGQSANVAISPAEAECDRQLAELKRRHDDAVMKIGLTFLAGNTPENVVGTPYAEFVFSVTDIDREIKFLEKRKLALRGLRQCEKCGNVLVLDSAFCNKCGQQLEPLFLEENKEQNVCPKCGASHTEGAAFCTSCGNKLS